MAVISNADMTFYKKALRTDPAAMTEIKAASISKAQMTAMFQVLEDNFEASRLSVRDAMRTASGISTLSNTFCRKCNAAWMRRKLMGE